MYKSGSPRNRTLKHCLPPRSISGQQQMLFNAAKSGWNHAAKEIEGIEPSMFYTTPKPPFMLAKINKANWFYLLHFFKASFATSRSNTSLGFLESSSSFILAFSCLRVFMPSRFNNVHFLGFIFPVFECFHGKL